MEASMKQIVLHHQFESWTDTIPYHCSLDFWKGRSHGPRSREVRNEVQSKVRWSFSLLFHKRVNRSQIKSVPYTYNYQQQRQVADRYVSKLTTTIYSTPSMALAAKPHRFEWEAVFILPVRWHLTNHSHIEQPLERMSHQTKKWKSNYPSFNLLGEYLFLKGSSFHGHKGFEV